MAIREELLASLTGDATLMAVLTGGVHTATEITRQNTPAAFDTNLELKPCALLKIETETTIPPHQRGSRLFAVVMFYQRAGQDAIDSARARVYDLWHEKKIGTNVWQILHTDDLTDLEDQALQASLALSRYAVVRLR